MKKVLILSYFYPPFNHISSQRPESFAQNFSKHGLYPVLVTRHYDKGGEFYEDSYKANTKEAEISENETHTEIRLPYFANRYQLLQTVKNVPLAERVLLTAYAALGALHVKTGMDEFADDYLTNYLKENKVDYILVTSPPLNSIKLGYKLSKKFNIPLVVDFRDLWDNNLLGSKYRPTAGKYIQNTLETTYIKKWLERAVLVTAVSEPILEVIKNLNPHVETLLVTNGFEEGLFAELSKPEDKNTSKFTFSVIGTIYPEQDLSVLFEGMKLFLNDKNLGEIQLNFVGTAYNREVGQKIAGSLPTQCTSVTNRFPRRQALEKLLESDILFHAGWRGFRGIASGKIFEYLGSRKKILIAPGDDDIMDKIVLETGAGKVANSAHEFAAVLNQWFDEWTSTGKVSYTGDYEKVLEYSRENQAAKLAKKIMSL